MAKTKAKIKKKAKAADAPKKRVRQHVIASLSTNFVERIIYEKGFTAERVENDYGFDLIMFTFATNGFVDPGSVFLQLKAKDKLSIVGGGSFVSFPISVSDYRTWHDEAYPVFLIVYDAANSDAYWLYVQKYFDDDPSRMPSKKASTVTVRIPITNTLTAATIDYMKDRKDKRLAQFKKVKHG